MATEQLHWWTALSSQQVVRLEGVTSGNFAVDLDPLPPDAPVVLSYSMVSPLSAGQHVDNILDALESSVARLFPRWLPGADLVASKSGFDRKVVRMLARELAAGSGHFGPFLADLAEAAFVGVAPARHFSSEIRVRGLARVIADLYERDHAVLAVHGTTELDDVAQHAAATAFSWLADHGIGVWLFGDVISSVDRFATVSVTGASHVEVPAPIVRRCVLDIPSLIGSPHPLSDIEQRMALALAQADWAVGHEWNQPWHASPLAPIMRVDLLWRSERCVVEFDGPDHRRAEKYADDRVRDNALTLQGFRVLRFTNDQVVNDMPLVLDIIHNLLTQLRTERNSQ